MNYQQPNYQQPTYMSDAFEKTDCPAPPETTPCGKTLCAIEGATKDLICAIQALRSRLEPILRIEPENDKTGEARECGQSAMHERLLRQQSEIEGARRLLERIESLLTV